MSGPPPPWLLRTVNPFVRVVLRSPMHGLLGRRLILLEYTGRRSGRAYAIPIGYFRWEPDELLCFTSRRWWTNLRDGDAVSVVLRGRLREATPSVVRSLDERARLLREVARRFGPQAYRRIFASLPTDREPTEAEARAAADRLFAVRFVLRAG